MYTRMVRFSAIYKKYTYRYYYASIHNISLCIHPCFVYFVVNIFVLIILAYKHTIIDFFNYTDGLLLLFTKYLFSSFNISPMAKKYLF